MDLESLTPIERELVLELPSDLNTIERAVDFVMHRCSPRPEDERRLRLNLRVGLTEALANAMRYGNARDPEKRVRIEVALRRCSVVARITDEGAGFDPATVPDPTLPANLTKPGGRGLFLMRQLLDEVHYNERGNAVTLILRLPGADGTEARAQA